MFSFTRRVALVASLVAAFAASADEAAANTLMLTTKYGKS